MKWRIVVRVHPPVIESYALWTVDRMGDIARNEATFYSNAEDYWREVPPTVDGMLGGYGSISNIDINGSKAFLQKFLGVRNSFKMLGYSTCVRLCLTYGVKAC